MSLFSLFSPPLLSLEPCWEGGKPGQSGDESACNLIKEPGGCSERHGGASTCHLHFKAGSLMLTEARGLSALPPGAWTWGSSDGLGPEGPGPIAHGLQEANHESPRTWKGWRFQAPSRPFLFQCLFFIVLLGLETSVWGAEVASAMN